MRRRRYGEVDNVCRILGAGGRELVDAGSDLDDAGGEGGRCGGRVGARGIRAWAGAGVGVHSVEVDLIVILRRRPSIGPWEYYAFGDSSSVYEYDGQRHCHVRAVAGEQRLRLRIFSPPVEERADAEGNIEGPRLGRLQRPEFSREGTEAAKHGANYQHFDLFPAHLGARKRIKGRLGEMRVKE